MTLLERAGDVLQAFARSRLEAVRLACDPNVLVYGTDDGERWSERDSFLEALDDMRNLGLSAEWLDSPIMGTNWVAGLALYRAPTMDVVVVRVTMVFAGDRLVHGHFSIEQAVSPS